MVESRSKTLILIVLALIIANAIFMISTTTNTIEKRSISLTAKASTSSRVSFCINQQPQINFSMCNTTVEQDQPYSCQLNTTDIDYINFTYSSQFLSLDRNFSDSEANLFDITSSGLISFTPDNYDVGYFSVNISVDDGIGCNGVDEGIFNITVTNINDPPYLVLDIPDVNYDEGESVHAFYLNTYFDDPDQDILTYTVTSTTFVIININPATSDVRISSNVCDFTEYVIFSAKDPYNRTANSNLVRITCTEDQQSSQISDSGTGSSGGGGGGGLSEICIPEYVCYDYHKCNKNGTKIQRCVDIHGCENEVFLTVPCDYREEHDCNESWECSEWDVCLPNGTQYRICVDENKCKSYEFMPVLVQECEYIGTCDDNIKNCHNESCEEGIDCGGPCAPCISIQVPFPFEEQKNIFILMLTGIILLILTSILLYHYFHKEINAALAKAGWVISGRGNKQILISLSVKKDLLDKLNKIVQSFDTRELTENINLVYDILKEFIIHACSKDLSDDFDLEELSALLNKKQHRIREGKELEIRKPELVIIRKMFLSAFEKHQALLKDKKIDKKIISKISILVATEELRNFILQTSEVEPEDVAREVKELDMSAALTINQIYNEIINTYIALEFLELDVAKEKYLQLTSDYEKLLLKDQENVYKDISALYNHITYVNSWYVFD